MDSENRKFTVLSFLSLSAIVAYVLYLILTEFADIFRFGGSNVMGTGLAWPVFGGSLSGILGLVAFIIMMNKAQWVDFTDDIFAELKKTTWPNFKETSASTVVVSIMTLIAALMFLVMDLIWGGLFKLVI